MISGLPTVRRRGAVAVNLLAAAASVAALLGLGFLLTNDAGTAEVVEVADAADTAPAPVAETAAAPAPLVTPAAETPVAAAEAPAVVEEQPAANELAEVADLESTIDAHLAAGEFSQALALARAAGPDAQRHLDRIARVQIDAGEFDAAFFSIRQMDEGYARNEIVREFDEEEDLAGGGANVDFQTLIDLIQSETSGLWEDIDGEGGTISEYPTGVAVDPAGTLARASVVNENLSGLRRQARVADLAADMAAPADLRLVNLTQLERDIAGRLEEGRAIPGSMKMLAGLTKVEYLFLEDNGDILVGGPAEGWTIDAEGNAVGTTSGRPIVQLDDLVTVLRIFQPGGNNAFSCSIEPRDAGLKAVQQYAKRNTNVRSPARWTQGLEDALGMQDIVFQGVPADSRVARVIIEADYKMKLVGIGKMDVGPNVPSYFDLLPASQQSGGRIDGLRWWLTMNYDAIEQSPAKDAFALKGQSVKCQSENEFLGSQGQRVATGASEAVNSKFAENFTRHYRDIAAADPVFADVENVFDLSLVAALIRTERLAERAGWDYGVFARGGAYQTATHNVPTEVKTVANFKRFRGGRLVAQVAGGVEAPVMALVSGDLPTQTTDLVDVAVEENAWWWNAE